MAFLPVYAVDGGKVPAEMLRRVAFAATSGASGIVRPADLQVRALDVPGSQVQVMPGSGLIADGYSDDETYAFRNGAADGDAILDVPKTSSGSGRTDYVVFRVQDPQYEGQVPPDPEDAIYGYLDLVSSVSNLTYPALLLARIDMPASTQAVEQSYITDLRQVANPREHFERRTINFDGVVEGAKLTVTSAGGEVWPNGLGELFIDIPSWATRCDIKCDWISVRWDDGNMAGKIWVEYGPHVSGSEWTYSTNSNMFDGPGGVVGYTRQSLVNADTHRPVPADIRGTTQRFVPKGRMTNPNGSSDPTMDAQSSLVLDVMFREIPVSDG